MEGNSTIGVVIKTMRLRLAQPAGARRVVDQRNDV
jgi:hypothetical protein